MVKLQATIEGDNIIISKDSFEHIMNCLANQKFIGDINADGLSEGKESYENHQKEMQDAIDNCWRAGMALLKPNLVESLDDFIEV